MAIGRVLRRRNPSGSGDARGFISAGAATPGQRLIEPSPVEKFSYFVETPAAFRPRAGELLVAPLHHIFGSEELSVLTPGGAERSPRPYLALNLDDASAQRVNEGEEIELALNGAVYRLPVRFHPALPRGVAGMPVGLRELPWAALPAWEELNFCGSRSANRTVCAAFGERLAAEA